MNLRGARPAFEVHESRCSNLQVRCWEYRQILPYQVYPQVYLQGSLNFHLLHFYPPYPYPHRNVHLLTVMQSVYNGGCSTDRRTDLKRVLDKIPRLKGGF